MQSRTHLYRRLPPRDFATQSKSAEKLCSKSLGKTTYDLRSLNTAESTIAVGIMSGRAKRQIASIFHFVGVSFCFCNVSLQHLLFVNLFGGLCLFTKNVFLQTAFSWKTLTPCEAALPFLTTCQVSPKGLHKSSKIGKDWKSNWI